MEDFKINPEEGELKNEYRNLLDKKEKLEKEILEINSKLEKLDYQNKKKFDRNETNLESKEIKYCLLKADGKLHESKGEEQGVFKILNIRNNTANLEYCGGPINLNYFDGVARFANNPYKIENIKKIITVELGFVEKNNNNEWIIKKPVKLKFE